MARRRPGVLVPSVLAAATALVMVSCSGGTADSLPSAADTAFVAALLPHHHLGMELVDAGARGADDVRLRRLVFEMGSYHGAEMAALQAWADAWKVAADDAFPGELEPGAIALLELLTGDDHDTWWLHLMIEHHLGAVTIARAQMAGGGIPEVVDMAAGVAAVQANELERMQALLAELCSQTPDATGC
jgi:uncharacterized protein (DUF305 family)